MNKENHFPDATKKVAKVVESIDLSDEQIEFAEALGSFLLYEQSSRS